MRPGKTLIAITIVGIYFVSLGYCDDSTTLSQKSPTIDFMGMNFNYIGTPRTPWPDSVPFSGIRSWDSKVSWADIQPHNSATYKWDAFDTFVDLASTHGKDILYTFGRTPSWANAQQTHMHDSGAEAPANLADWDAFVTAVAKRAHGRIKYWEIWNEASSTRFWKGDIPTLITMAQHARSIIKAIDPEAVIVSPSATKIYATQRLCDVEGADCGTTWMNQWLALGGKNVVDVVAFHNYPSHGPVPEKVVGQVALEKAVLAANGVANLPIWDTESSWTKNKDLPDDAGQVAFVGRHLLIEASLGVQRCYWYAYDDPIWGTLWWSPSYPGPTGSVGITPAGTAYITLAGWLKNASFASACAATPDDSMTWTCSLTLGDGTLAEAVWNTLSTKSFSVDPAFKEYRTLDGKTTAITGTSVMISAQPILLHKTGG